MKGSILSEKNRGNHMASKPIMQFKAELTDAHIPIWRRFKVMNDVRFSRLAYLLMTMFEMEGGHLFAFHIDVAGNIRRHTSDEFNGARTAKEYEEAGIAQLEVQMPISADWVSEAEEEMGMPVKDATREYVKWHVTNVGDELFFEYDFGDGWEVKLTLENAFEDENLSGRELPRVIAGEGYGIIEDCGGTGGLERIDKAFSQGSGYEYKEFKEWLGTDTLDLSSFDIDMMNEMLKTEPAFLRNAYEEELR